MRATEVTLGRSFVLAFEHGDHFLPKLRRFCEEQQIRQAVIPMFLAGFSRADVVGTCDPETDPSAPVWSVVRLRHVEAVGAGIVVYDPEGRELKEHIHLSVGEKLNAARGFTSHLKQAVVQFTGEMFLTEILTPPMLRIPDGDLHNVPLLRF